MSQYEKTPSDAVLVKQAIDTQLAGSGADAITGSAIDTIGYETLFALVNVGDITDAANNSVEVQLQDSSVSGSGFTDVSGATTGTILNAGDGEPYIIEVNLSEYDRYLKAVVDGGSVDGGYVGVTFCLMLGRHLPPAQDNTVVRVGYA